MSRISRWKRAGVAVALLAALTTVSVGAAALGDVVVGRQADGSIVVPTHQVITPAGQQVQVCRPNAVAVRPDGKTAAFLDGCNGGALVSIVDLGTGTVLQRFNPQAGGGASDGLTYSADGSHLYASDTQGKLLIADVAAGGTISGTLVDLPQTQGNPYPEGLALSGDGTTLYVALSRNNTLGVFDLATRTLTAEIPVGNAPHGVVVAGDRAYVSDEGGRRAQAGEFTNDSSGTAIVANPQSGGVATGAVSVVDLAAQTAVQTITVGLEPTGLYLDHGTLFVANTDSDTLSLIDTATNQVRKTVAIQPFPSAPFGSTPTAVNRLPDGRLVVSLAANNALAVYTYNGPEAPVRFDGLLPTGWYPGALGLDTQRGRVIVANVKGEGSTGGPSVYNQVTTASLIPYPTAADLGRGTAQVAQNNGWNRLDATASEGAAGAAAAQAIPARIGDPSPIKHVFYIIKENNTYDAFLGDDSRGNGDPRLTLFGKDVTPNQHQLARQFPLFDNLYASGIASDEGHQWTDESYVSSYLEKMEFGGPERGYPYNGGDSLAYAPTGFLWQNAERHGLTVRDYGEYANQATNAQGQSLLWDDTSPWAAWYQDALILEGKAPGQLHYPLGYYRVQSDVPSLDRVLNRDYPPFDPQVSDQYRADIFLREFQQYVKARSLPNLLMLTLGDDHTGGDPTPRAQVADNDLALGRIVDAISHSPYWQDSAIFVVEDDAQNDLDHVDGHRMVGFAISPYARHGLVDHTFYTHIDVVRTIEQILGLPPMNQFDLAAAPLRDAFQNNPDLTPYDALTNTVPLTEGIAQTIVVSSSTALSAPAAATASGHSLATPYTLAGLRTAWRAASKLVAARTRRIAPDGGDPALLARAIWYSVKGYTTPYPGDKTVLTPRQVLAQERGGSDAGPASRAPVGRRHS